MGLFCRSKYVSSSRMVAHLRFVVAVEASVVEVVVRIAEPWVLASVLVAAVALIVVLPAQAVIVLAP